jgi:TonB family protein
MKGSIFFLIVIIFILVSCNSGNGPRVLNSSENKRTEQTDSSNLNKDEPDNYLIDNTVSQDKGEVYMYCEVMPEFPGGDKAFSEYIRKKIKYPRISVLKKTEGRVVMKFIIGSTGKIDEVKVLRSISKELDDECIRVFSNLPDWKPGTINKKPVAVSYSIPVRFVLTKSENLNGIYILP